MGIQGLTKFISDCAPHAIKVAEMKDFFGRKVAIDASMCIYQFLIAVRSEGNALTNEEGETTSHLMGTFYRTLRLVENGLKPVYVFEGKPPDMKGGELEKRKERREEANRELEKAQAEDNAENIEKYSKRLIKVTQQHNDDCKTLLRLMGIPCVDAPGEAEAQCAALARAGKVYAVGTEDMDSLTFGAPILLRHLTFSEARKLPIKEFNLTKILAGLNMDQDKFIDLCILLGCDYLDTIKGIGPKKAKEYLESHENLESLVKFLTESDTKYTVPEDWPFQRARQLFKEPLITDPNEIDLKWTDPDEEGLVEFLCKKNGFSEDRVRNGVKKLLKSKTNASQGRIDTFFSFKPADPAKVAIKPGAKKEEPGSAKKRGKTGTPARGGAKRPK